MIPYAEMRTFRALARDICAYMPEPADLVLTDGAGKVARRMRDGIWVE